MNTPAPSKVEQRHRDAAADLVFAYRGNRDNGWHQRIRDGKCDDGEMVQSFARFEATLTPAPSGEGREAIARIIAPRSFDSEGSTSWYSREVRRRGAYAKADAILALLSRSPQGHQP